MRDTFYILAVLLLCFAPAALPGGAARIVFTSDLHGRIENFAALTTAIKAHSDARTVGVDLGDTVSGNFDAEYAENSTGMAEALNLAGIRFWVPGNHDFELPHANFRDFVRRFYGTALGGDWHKAGMTGKPYALVETGGVRIALVGLTEPRMPQRLLPGSGMEFRDQRQLLREILPEIRKQHPHIIVLAWHNGLYSMLGPLGKFLREFPEIDLVLGAHSHQENPGERVGNALYVQAGAHGHAAGVVDIATDDASGRVVKVTSFLIRPDALHPDPAVAQLAARLRRESGGLYRRKLGGFAPPLKRIGTLCAEATRICAGADVGVIWVPATNFSAPGDGIRHYGDLYRLLPHRNEVCSLVVTRDELAGFLGEQRKLDRRHKRKTELFVSGPGIKLHRSPRGEVFEIDAPDTLRLAVSDYRICASRILRPLADRADRGFRRTGILERDAAAALMTGSTQHP